MILENDDTLITFSETETMKMASLMAGFVYPGLAIFLSGDLGAGKTVFTRGLSNALGLQGVRSPSFTLINEYESPDSISVAHVDLYRLDPGDESDLDLHFYLESGYLLIVEWAEKIMDPPLEDIWRINLYSMNQEGVENSAEDHVRRKITISAIGEKASANLKKYLETIKKEIVFQ